MKASKKIFTKCRELSNPWEIDVYLDQGGYQSLSKAFDMTPEEIIKEVKDSNLRGRGGAGFPTGIKWGFMDKKSNKPRYLVINGDEGEPGTFKDRLILEMDPHRLIEGCIVSCYALDAHTCYIYIRGEMTEGHRRVNAAIRQAYDKGYLGKNILDSGFDLDIYVHSGAGAYICGEETALLESIEGKPGRPRMKPPFPAVVGLFGSPTIINNVETISSIPTIINEGGKAFAEDGCFRNGGIKMYSISGHVKRPGVYEAPHGISLRDLIYGEDYCQGVWKSKKIKAVIPGGSSCPVLRPDPNIDWTKEYDRSEIDSDMSYATAQAEVVDLRKISMDFDSLKKLHSLFGTGGVIVMDEDTCMVRVAANLAHFYHGESCGQCTPCREGTGWMVRILDAIEAGRGTKEDIQLLHDICDNIEGNTICPHGDAAAMAIRSYLLNFPEEFEAHVEQKACPFPEWTLPGATND